MLYIHFFGHLRLFQDKQALEFTALPKTLPLWAYLLLNRADPVRRDTLAYLLWPDTSEKAARANLRRHLYDLRRALPPAPSDAPWVSSQTGNLQWNPDADYWLDVAEFERLSASSDHLAKAARLYSDDLLPDIYEDWIFFERERLRNTYLNNLTQLVVQSRTRGDHAQAIVYVQSILNHDPLREDAIRELISLRYQGGDRAGAIQTYQHFERHLQAELGVAPMLETRTFYEAVILNAPLPTGPPHTTTPRAPLLCPHNLPAQFNVFVGREQDLVAIRETLISVNSRVRLLTLTGPAGTGKTRLALEMAARLLPNQASAFPDGIFFVDLTAIDKPDLVIPTIATTLEVKESKEQPLFESLARFLRPKHLLLLLDNFEHVPTAGPLIAELLKTSPNLRTLVTSRAPLRVYGEHEYPISPLPLPDSDLADALLDNASATLFLARARERKPDLVMTAKNAAAIAKICIALDGLPLAIELAASRVKLFSPSAILQRLTSQLAFLTNGPRDMPKRHQTLREAIGWSYDLLEKEEKKLFATLGVFAGGCTLEAANTLCAPLCKSDVPGGLASLVDDCLLQQFESDDGELRFRMLASIREYALEQLSKMDGLTATQQIYAEYYADLAEQAKSGWRGPEQAAWIRRLNAEDDNLRTALAWCLAIDANAARAQLGEKLTRAIWLYWEINNRLSESRSWHTQALAHRAYLSLETQARLLIRAGWTAQFQGEYQSANSYFQESINLARQLGEPKLISLGLHSLGSAAGHQGKNQLARVMLLEAISIERKISGKAMTTDLSILLNNLAIVLKNLGDYAQAAVLLQESLDFRRAQGDQLGAANSLANLGNLALAQKNHTAAHKFYQESLSLRQTLGDRKGMLGLLPGLAELAMAWGQSARSVCLYSANKALRQVFNYPLAPREHKLYTLNITSLREQLGETDFAAAWGQGELMSLDEAVNYASNSIPPIII